MPVDLLRDEIIRFQGGRDEGPENAALAEWAAEAQSKGEPGPEPPKVRRALGPCRICRERPAKHVCVSCGRDACQEDYWIMLGLCRECLNEDEIEAARNREPERPELGIKWVED